MNLLSHYTEALALYRNKADALGVARCHVRCNLASPTPWHPADRRQRKVARKLAALLANR